MAEAQIDNSAKQVEIWPVALFALIGIFGYLTRTTHWFTMVPGDLGDARFNSIILEHFYRWLQGKSASLWSPEFFYPYPNTLAFSDNHFGTAWIYAIARLLGLSRELAFDAWFCTGFLLSYSCCAYAARKFGFSWLASAVAAFVFAYSPPIIAQELHAQLIYRYAIPLAVLSLWQILEFRRFDRLPWLAIWVAVQFFCSIYLGLFTVMLAGAMIAASCIKRSPRVQVSTNVSARHPALQIALFCAAALIWVGLLLMLRKYHSVANEYGFHRGIGEIRSMLPRIGSYFIADNFKLDAWIGRWITQIPMRHEHQMFFGLGSSILAIVGALTARKSPKWSRPALIFALALLALILMTLSVGHFSLYRAVISLPGFNSIRAVTRICLVMLLPVAWLAAIGVEILDSRFPGKRLLFAIPVAVLFTVELLSYTPYHVPITQWEDRLSPLKADLKPFIKRKHSIIFVRANADEPLPGLVRELDGMMLAQDTGVPTVNGYSGNLPPYFGSPDSCMTAANRLTNAAAYTHLSPDNLSDMLKRLVALPTDASCANFTNLRPYKGPLPNDVFKNISLSIVDQTADSSGYIVTIEIRNRAQTYLPSLSMSNEPVQLSWQFVPEGQSVNENAWNTRSPLDEDIPSGATYRQRVRVEAPTTPGRYKLAFSLVQEQVSWFHYKGMSIAMSDMPVDVHSR